MNGALAAAGAGAAVLLYWRIAVSSAARRRLTIGTLPLGIPLFAVAGASGAALEGFHAPAIFAGAGVAVAGIVDARTGSIFDPLTGAVLLISLALALLDGSSLESAGGAACVGGALLVLYLLTDGRGIGLGDVKLGIALGAALGASSGLTALAFAFIFGGSYGGWLLATQRAARDTAIRFAPFMAAGTFAALLAPCRP